MINCNRRDGSARAVNEVAERLARKGHDVHIWARKMEDIDLSLVSWHHVPGPGWPEVADFWSYHRLANLALAKHDFDIVHSIGCNTLCANVVTIQNIQPAKREILERIGNHASVSLPRRLTRWLYLRTTSNAERRLYTGSHRHPLMFLPVSHGVESELRRHYQLREGWVRIIPNAADAAKFRPVSESERGAWRSANGFAEGDFICIFSGGEWARKGLDSAIRAISLLPQENVKLFVAGEDAESGRFKTMAREAGAGDRVIFGGFRPDIATALAASDLFLFPSHYEAFSLATIEAAACGIPIAATKINGTEDLITPGENGVFIGHDPRQIAQTLRPLLENSALRRMMGANGRHLVERSYTWDRVTEMTEAAYLEVLERKRKDIS